MASSRPVTTVQDDDDDTVDSITNLLKGMVTPSTPSFFKRGKQGIGILSSILGKKTTPSPDPVPPTSSTFPDFSTTPSTEIFGGTHPSRVQFDLPPANAPEPVSIQNIEATSTASITDHAKDIDKFTTRPSEEITFGLPTPTPKSLLKRPPPYHPTSPTISKYAQPVTPSIVPPSSTYAPSNPSHVDESGNPYIPIVPPTRTSVPVFPFATNPLFAPAPAPVANHFPTTGHTYPPTPVGYSPFGSHPAYNHQYIPPPSLQYPQVFPTPSMIPPGHHTWPSPYGHTWPTQSAPPSWPPPSPHPTTATPPSWTPATTVPPASSNSSRTDEISVGATPHRLINRGTITRKDVVWDTKRTSFDAYITRLKGLLAQTGVSYLFKEEFVRKYVPDKYIFSADFFSTIMRFIICKRNMILLG